MVAQATVLGMEPASAARIIGAFGIVFGVLTVFVGFFAGWFIGVFADGILTACLYSALLCVLRASGAGLYLTFIVVNGLLIVGKLVYALILILSVTSYGYGYGYGYDAPGMYHSPDSFAPGPGMHGPGGMGLFGMGYDHGIYGGSEYGLYGYEYYRTLMVVAIVIIGISLIFNAFAEFVILRVWQVSKIYSAVGNNTPRTSTVGAEPAALAYPATYYVDPGMRDPIYPTNV